jgi:hypothetical protein
MEKHSLSTQIESGMTLAEIAKERQCALTTVRYWLKKYGLKTKNGVGKRPTFTKGDRKCAVCARAVPDYQRGNKCGACAMRIIHYRTKTKAVEYKGGKCQDCGWIGHVVGYDFHHRDPAQKEFTISSHKNRSWERIVVELDKCDLLCAMCHRMKHQNYDDIQSYLESAL